MSCHGNASGNCKLFGLGLSHLVTLAIGIFIGTQIVKCCEKRKAVEGSKKDEDA